MINLSYFYKQSLFVSTTNPTAGRINKQYLKKKNRDRILTLPPCFTKGGKVPGGTNFTTILVT